MPGEPEIERHSRALAVLALVLWIVSSTLCVVLIPTTIDMATRIYAAFQADYSEFGSSYWGGVVIRQFLVLPLVVLAVAVIIGGAEVHMRNFGTRKSWLFYTQTLAIEIGLLLMGWII